MNIRRGYIDVPHGQIHYRRAGSEGAPLLVLLHQTPSTSAMYGPLMIALAGDFDLLALDTPGFGQSDALPGELSIAGAAAVLSEAVDQLHQGACSWFGHHTGAALALQVAYDHPEQVARLAMSGPCLLDDALRERLPMLAQPIPPAADGSHLQLLWERIANKDATIPLPLCHREVLSGAASGDAYPQAYQAVVEVDTEAQLKALGCPTLVFAGTEDPLYSRLEPAFGLLANGQKAEIAGAKTYVCETHTAEVARLLGDFF